MLQKEFSALVAKYASDRHIATVLWSELETAYAHPDRYFHNLTHIEQMLAALRPLQPQVDDWDTLLFAVFYHDSVYDVVKYVTENNNEDESAALAGKALTSIGYPAHKIERCQQHILATKAHRQSNDGDTNLLIDADLFILGQPWEVYELYMKAIRREYGIYPDNIYNAGRVHVLKGFLRGEQLFKTEAFKDYDTTARENIERELEILSFY